MSKLITFSKSCESIDTCIAMDPADLCGCSVDLEMTVNMLIQIDKLVQLLESPVFTCELLNW